MSTKAIRKIIEAHRALGLKVRGSSAMDLHAALDEVESIERAAKDLDRLAIGDGVYDVRDRDKTLRETPEGHDTWGHPDVKAWGDAATLMRSIAKDAP